ncbi:hypothetical protein AMELA_G00049600 [Ameiurus melas]|uniref:Uncharacterized protein n=2 Tax=Ictaluridae TaxID=7996 RepID=A0A7J6B5R7_AMEME|nr:hypothetical protein AMELA_G00049600 [Ameiurus melas]
MQYNMSKRNGFGPGYFRMLENARLMQAHEAMVDVMNGRSTQCDFVLNALGYGCGLGLDYTDHLNDYEELTDDEDDDEYDRQHNRYCGFTQHFLDKGVSKQLPAITHYKTVKYLTPEEAAKNAKELLDEEDKHKKKSEKKKQKKMRQRERRRLEKLEKENGSQDGAKQDDAAVPVKPKPSERECENKKKTNNSVPPDPGPQHNSVATESSDSCDEDDDADDEKESVVDELELDMSSCFVTNAAAIAKRKLEQKPKPDWKDKKTENLKKLGTAQKSTEEPQIKNVNEMEASDEPVKDNITKSMELAVIGNKYAQAGNLDMAVKYFTDAIKHNPQEVNSCTDAAQELMRVQIMQLMDMGYTREQSSNALIIHGTVEKALEALSGLHGNMAAAHVHVEEVRVCPERNLQPMKVPLRPVPLNPPKVTTAVPATLELFPVWVGDLVPAISELRLHELFSRFGPVHSVKLLPARRCAFVNYTKKEDCEQAIKQMHGFCVAGTYLVVRYPDRIHTHLGVSKSATTDAGKVNKFPDECYFWRTTGCIKNNRCSYRHVPEHRGVDRPKV